MICTIGCLWYYENSVFDCQSKFYYGYFYNFHSVTHRTLRWYWHMREYDNFVVQQPFAWRAVRYIHHDDGTCCQQEWMSAKPKFLEMVTNYLCVMETAVGKAQYWSYSLTNVSWCWHKTFSSCQHSLHWEKRTSICLTHCCLMASYGKIDLGNIASGNGLLPDEINTLSYHRQGPVTFNWGQFHKRYLRHQALKLALNFQI